MELNNTLKQYKRVLKKMADWDVVEKEQRDLEIECGERRFNDLLDIHMALSRKNKRYRVLLEELYACSNCLENWDLPVGFKDIVEEVLRDDA